jgi:hypothetical protein
MEGDPCLRRAFADEPRLADPGISADQEYRWDAIARVPDGAAEAVELRATPHELLAHGWVRYAAQYRRLRH